METPADAAHRLDTALLARWAAHPTHQAIVDGVEYVDTSKYEQYEKQEGDFVEGAEAAVAAEPAAEPAEATVPPDDKVN